MGYLNCVPVFAMSENNHDLRTGTVVVGYQKLFFEPKLSPPKMMNTTEKSDSENSTNTSKRF